MQALWTTLQVSALALAGALVLGLPLGLWLGLGVGRVQSLLRSVFEALLGLPTVLVGLVAYAFLSRRGPLGFLGMLYTVEGMALALGVLALPIVVSLSTQAVERERRRLRENLMVLGARGLRLAVEAVWECRHGLSVALMASLSRVATEVGVAMMVGGNIRGVTRTMTTAIALETGKGEFERGVAMGILLLIVTGLLNLATALLRKEMRHERPSRVA